MLYLGGGRLLQSSVDILAMFNMCIHSYMNGDNRVDEPIHWHRT